MHTTLAFLSLGVSVREELSLVHKEHIGRFFTLALLIGAKIGGNRDLAAKDVNRKMQCMHMMELTRLYGMRRGQIRHRTWTRFKV